MRQSLSTNIDAGDASDDVVGPALDASYVYSMSVQTISTGTSTGAVNVQASNDPPDLCSRDANGNLQPANWTNIASATVAITAASTLLIPKLDVCYRWVRTAFVKNNGESGTITTHVNTIGPS